MSFTPSSWHQATAWERGITGLAWSGSSQRPVRADLQNLSNLTEYAQAYGRSLTVIKAAKINWYDTNHHTGQGGPAHVIIQALQTVGAHFSLLSTSNEMIVTLNKAGHWVSTHLVFNALANSPSDNLTLPWMACSKSGTWWITLCESCSWLGPWCQPALQEFFEEPQCVHSLMPGRIAHSSEN